MSYVATDADQRYSELLDRLTALAGSEGHVVNELDEVVGQRLNEAQKDAVHHLLRMFQRAAEGDVDWSLLP